MIYELVLLMFGVYLGQEYTAIPSVKIIIIKGVDYFQSHKK